MRLHNENYNPVYGKEHFLRTMITLFITISMIMTQALLYRLMLRTHRLQQGV
jgi:hypothetical protein